MRHAAKDAPNIDIGGALVEHASICAMLRKIPEYYMSRSAGRAGALVERDAHINTYSNIKLR